MLPALLFHLFVPSLHAPLTLAFSRVRVRWRDGTLTPYGKAMLRRVRQGGGGGGGATAAAAEHSDESLEQESRFDDVFPSHDEKGVSAPRSAGVSVSEELGDDAAPGLEGVIWDENNAPSAVVEISEKTENGKASDRGIFAKLKSKLANVPLIGRLFKGNPEKLQKAEEVLWSVDFFKM